VRPNEWTEEASDDRCIIILFITQAKILVVNDWHPAKNHACEEKQRLASYLPLICKTLACSFLQYYLIVFLLTKVLSYC